MTTPIVNRPSLIVPLLVYRGDSQTIQITLTENGLPLSAAMLAALSNPLVTWRMQIRSRADAAVIGEIADIALTAGVVEIYIPAVVAAKFPSSCRADLQVSWPGIGSRIEVRTLAILEIEADKDVTL